MTAMTRARILILFSLAAQFAWAQTPSFEVATIKPAAPSTDGHTHINYPSGDRFSASNITLIALMQWAYKMPARQIISGPSWLSSSRFDIQATIDANQIEHLDQQAQTELKQRMVQSLFADRFHMKIHQETRTMPAYDLVVAKDGTKLQPSHANGKSIGIGRSHFNGEGLPMTIIAEELSQIAGRAIVNKTGLSGYYDFKLQWAPDDATGSDSNLPSFFTALQEQLGLKLISTKEPIPVLVIDHLDQPTPN